MYFCIGKYYRYMADSRGRIRIMRVTGIGKENLLDRPTECIYYKWIDTNIFTVMPFADASCVFDKVPEEDLELLLLAAI
jgi:hypothetical protein